MNPNNRKVEYQTLDTYLIPRRVVRFIVEGYVRRVLSQMRKDWPDPDSLLEEYNSGSPNDPEYMEKVLRYTLYTQLIDVMRSEQMSLQQVRYLKQGDIKVHFEERG
jgi:hypothetical protein